MPVLNVAAGAILHTATSDNLNGLQCAGTGAAGLAAAALGASITLTDLPHLLPNLERNIEANELAASATVAPLDWRSEPSSWDDRIQPGQYDFIIGSDLVYDMTLVPHLIRVIGQLAGSDTKLLLAYERREGTDAFDDALKASRLGEVELVSFFDLHPEWSSPDIWVYEIQRVPAQSSAPAAAAGAAAGH